MDVLAVGRVSGSGDEDLVAGFDHGSHHDVDALADTGGDVDVLWGDDSAVLLVLPVDDRLAQVQVALGVTVSVVGLVDRGPERRLEVLRGLEVPLVGVPDVEIKELLTRFGGSAAAGTVTSRIA